MTSVLTSITEVFTAVITWIISGVNAVIPMFYSTTDGLTFMGVLAVCGLAFSVAFLLIGIIQRFLHFRG